MVTGRFAISRLLPVREAFGDIWAMDGDLLCVTTNLKVNSDGEAVMGGGIAREARELYPTIGKELGRAIRDGRRTVVFSGILDQWGMGRDLCAFPTKDHYKNPSTLELIEESAQALASLIEVRGYKNVLLPRPGCGLGGLTWDQVKPVLEKHLDDRVIIVGFASEANAAV